MTGVMEKLLSEERDEGRLEGRQEGRQEGKTDTLVQLVCEGILTISDAAARLSMSEEQFRRLMDERK